MATPKRLRAFAVVDAPAVDRKRSSLDVAAFFKRYAALAALVVLLAFNFAVTPHFASWQTLNVNLTQVATIVIVSVGMTLVIATGGIDLSVGSLMAISGALAPMIFLSSFGRSYPALGDRARLCRSGGRRRPFWPVQRLVHHPVPGPADRRHAGHVHRRAGHRASLDQRQSATVQEPDISVHRPRPHLRRSVSGRHHAGAGRSRRLGVAQHPVRPADPLGRRQRAGGASVGRSGRAVKRWVYAISGLLRRHRRADRRSPSIRRATPISSASAWSSTRSRRSRLAARRSPAGKRLWSAPSSARSLIQLVRYTLLANGVPDAAALVVKGGDHRRRRLVAAAGRSA